MEPKKSVGEMLKKGASVATFVRLEVGEGIEKQEMSFAEEVAQLKKVNLCDLYKY